MGSGFTGEFPSRFYSYSFEKFVVQMLSAWTSKQDGLVRFPSGSGYLKLEFPRGTKSHARALRDLALESGDARTSIVYFRRAWLRFVRSPKSRWVVITASPTLLT